MAARTIVTSHPDVACDICGRRLLRGEQPDVFLSAGQRRVVCELCTSRATHEGWRRETEEHTARPRSERPQRGRSLLGRLRQSRQLEHPAPAEAEWSAAPAEEWATAASWDGAGDAPSERPELEQSDLGRLELDRPELNRSMIGAVEPALADQLGGTMAGERLLVDLPVRGDRAAASVRRALEVFNAGEHPRRVAGVARSLGAPSVRAAPVAEAAEKVAVVVAWELCWYRYEVDLEDEAQGAWLAAEGMELAELPGEDRVANAAADERGELALLE
jgi:hypothetical protein